MHVRKAAATLALFAAGIVPPATAADPAVYVGKAVVTAVGPKCPDSVPAVQDNVGSYYTIAYLTRPLQFTLNGHDWMQQFTDKTSKIFKWQAIEDTTGFSGRQIPYSGFAFNTLSPTAARLTFTVKYGKTCSESFRAALSLPPK